MHCGIWVTWLIGRTAVDLDCSLQALARCCRKITCHMTMTEWPQHDWTGPADCASVQPMTTCRSRATESPKHKIARRLVTPGTWATHHLGFPILCTGGNCEYCFCLIIFIKMVLCQQSNQTTIPYHTVKFCSVVGWSSWKKSKTKMIFYWSKSRCSF